MKKIIARHMTSITFVGFALILWSIGLYLLQAKLYAGMGAVCVIFAPVFFGLGLATAAIELIPKREDNSSPR